MSSPRWDANCFPVTALRQWGGDYLFDPSEPRHCLLDRRTGSPVAPVRVHTSDGKVVLPDDDELVMREPDARINSRQINP